MVQGKGGITSGIGSEPVLVCSSAGQTDEVRQEELLMFADDAVIGSENREQVEESMERWGYGYV